MKTRSPKSASLAKHRLIYTAYQTEVPISQEKKLKSPELLRKIFAEKLQQSFIPLVLIQKKKDQFIIFRCPAVSVQPI